MSELPQYQCHKIVGALKIKALQQQDLPKWTGITCSGSKSLGYACGRCEKCKWQEVNGLGNQIMMTPEESGYAPIMLPPDYMAKHRPEVGGYYVVYPDGYASYCPTKPFEDGYTIIV